MKKSSEIIREAAEPLPEHERELVELAALWTRRDDIIRAAVAGGVPITTVHELLGIARTTIHRIIRRV